jgi:hypothetical protein
METSTSSETLVSYHNTARRHKAEDFDLSLHRRENFKSCIWNSSQDVVNFILIVKILFIMFSIAHTGSFGIALGYGLDDRGSWVRFPSGAGNFSLHHRVQIGSGAHPASCPMDNRDFFPGGKAAGACSLPFTSI